MLSGMTQGGWELMMQKKEGLTASVDSLRAEGPSSQQEGCLERRAETFIHRSEKEVRA